MYVRRVDGIKDYMALLKTESNEEINGMLRGFLCPMVNLFMTIFTPSNDDCMILCRTYICNSHEII